MKKYKKGLFIGRFQPFHKGHLYIIKKALERAEALVIGVGSARAKDKGNPLSFNARKKMLEKVIINEGWKNKIADIVPLRDYPNDDNLWLEKTIEKTGKIDVFIGNNEWPNGIFEKAGFAVLRPGFYKRHLYEGRKIRELIRKGKNWQNRVPAAIKHRVKNLMRSHQVFYKG